MNKIFKNTPNRATIESLKHVYLQTRPGIGTHMQNHNNKNSKNFCKQNPSNISLQKY